RRTEPRLVVNELLFPCGESELRADSGAGECGLLRPRECGEEQRAAPLQLVPAPRRDEPWAQHRTERAVAEEQPLCAQPRVECGLRLRRQLVREQFVI